MPKKKELKEEDIKKVSGGVSDEDEPIVKKSVDDNRPEENIKGSNARPNH